MWIIDTFCNMFSSTFILYLNFSVSLCFLEIPWQSRRVIQMFTESGADHSLLSCLHQAPKLTVSPLRRLPLPHGGTKACRLCLNNPPPWSSMQWHPDRRVADAPPFGFDSVCFQSVIRLWTLRKSSPRSSWLGATNLCQFSSHCNPRPFLSSSTLLSPFTFPFLFFSIAGPRNLM